MHELIIKVLDTRMKVWDILNSNFPLISEDIIKNIFAILQ